ncbi:hypothetical protein [Zunongwangia sp. H14]|uniref:hypothetical protein n=1 Tax=Zunongwangia sp. H14 TaxID=3240792 RepID=UPI0035635C39
MENKDKEYLKKLKEDKLKGGDYLEKGMPFKKPSQDLLNELQNQSNSQSNSTSDDSSSDKDSE